MPMTGMFSVSDQKDTMGGMIALGFWRVVLSIDKHFIVFPC